MKKETTLPDELARLLLLETDEDVKTEDDSPSLDYRRDIRSILTALYERAPYIYALFKAVPKTEFRIALTEDFSRGDLPDETYTIPEFCARYASFKPKGQIFLISFSVYCTEKEREEMYRKHGEVFCSPEGTALCEIDSEDLDGGRRNRQRVPELHDVSLPRGDFLERAAESRRRDDRALCADARRRRTAPADRRALQHRDRRRAARAVRTSRGDRLRAGGARRMKTGKGPIMLSDEARDRVSEQLHARYVATIVGRLREVGTLDLAAADLPIRVVDRPIDDFRTDPSLDLARYVRDVLVDRAAYLDERSFRLDFTESDFNLDDYVLHGDAAEDDRPIVRLAGREGSMTVRSDGFRAAPYLALHDCCALSQLVEYAMRIRSGAVDPRSLPLFQLECCLSDRFEQDWNRVAEAVRRRR